MQIALYTAKLMPILQEAQALGDEFLSLEKYVNLNYLVSCQSFIFMGGFSACNAVIQLQKGCLHHRILLTTCELRLADADLLCCAWHGSSTLTQRFQSIDCLNNQHSRNVVSAGCTHRLHCCNSLSNGLLMLAMLLFPAGVPQDPEEA